ncbi:MAG: methylenetetrahydrofolate reductase [Pseudomonadota bacterium]
MALLKFRRDEGPVAGSLSPEVETFLKDYSIEVMPRTAEKIDDFRAILPEGTRVYIAHIEGTPINDMVATAKRLNAQGFPVMPHFPARIIKDRATLEDWIARYQGEADVRQALLLAGGVDRPHGDFESSIQLMETGAFDKAGFKRLHVAGHPEGNKDIDPDGGMRNVEAALHWKQGFCERTDAEMAIATQFAFEAGPIIAWADALKKAGVNLPIHIGIAGPAKLQTLIKFSIACGVGPSLRVLQRRAKDVTKLLLPFEPVEVISDLAAHKAQNPDFNVTHVHFFPLGGIKTSAHWAIENGGSSAVPANAA